MKHSLIVQMHPDGVFVFLSLLIYGGLFSTQKNLHFNFHYLYLSPQCCSPGRELVPHFAPVAPHSPSIREETGAEGTGDAPWKQAHAAVISSKIFVHAQHEPSAHLALFLTPFLHAGAMEEEGSSPMSCLGPNMGCCLLTCSL